MSGRPSSRSSRSSSGSHASGDYEELRLPNSKAIKALIYFCGRDPRKAKSVRRYYDDDFDDRSSGSGGSIFSRSSGTSHVYLVESTHPYWYQDGHPDAASYSSSARKRELSKKGRPADGFQRSPRTSTWNRHARVDADADADYDDDDSSSSEGSAAGYGGQYAGPYPPHPGNTPSQGVPPPPPHHHPPHPHHPGLQGPPPGAFQPVYSYPPRTTPQPTPVARYPVPPPPPPAAAGGMPPPPPGGHFVPGRGGVQVFVDG
ncbi:uncharacterized protein P884DRAFT_294254 [Thermothelomyces heterothallicus CBS 202.75]|uniref:uncharacterized protein n=1 Tax=Thermothelomyces heterothallicus CBS 202.75 TaxID=1149848 RepID=UPI003741FC0E